VREEEGGAEVREEEALPPGLPRTVAEAMPQMREGAHF